MDTLTPEIKLIIAGHAQHGKGTACAYLHDRFGLICRSSSHFAVFSLELFDDIASELSPGIPLTAARLAFYDNRGEHRALMYDRMHAYSKTTGFSGLATAMQADGISVYDGIRNDEEFEGSEHLFDAAIWIDASKRKPLESESSISVTPSMCHYVVDNNGTSPAKMFDQLNEIILNIAAVKKLCEELQQRNLILHDLRLRGRHG